MTTADAKTPAEISAEIIATLSGAISALETARETKGDDFIAAWSYGLGVAISVTGKPYAASLDRAEAFDPRHCPAVYNGRNEPALSVRRRDAIDAYLPTLKASFFQFAQA